MPQIPLRVEELTRLLEGRVAGQDAVTERLQWFLHFAQCQSVSATCRAFGISRPTFYRWARRFNLNDLSTLEDLPTRPALLSVLSAAQVTAQRIEEGPLVQHPTQRPRALSCLRTRDWRSLRRTLFVASILTNVALVAALVGFALLEVHVHGATQAANIVQESSSVPFTFP